MLSPFKKLKIALLADELTTLGLSKECRVKSITPRNYKYIFKWWKPDLLFVESAWYGYQHAWKKKLASYPGITSSHDEIKNLIHLANEAKIPAIFWNKEDGIHFNRFIDCALLFNHIFTTDENMIDNYQARFVSPHQQISTLMFAVQPRIHYFEKNLKRDKSFCFLGSYTEDIHSERKEWQNILFTAAQNYGLVIYDRNSARTSSKYRYPQDFKADVRNKIPPAFTGEIYKRHTGCLNVNTITNSRTMFSRRLIEILACGSPVISTPALSIDTYFKEYVFTVTTENEALEVMNKLSRGYDKPTQEMLKAGADHISKNYTYQRKLQQIMERIVI